MSEKLYCTKRGADALLAKKQRIIQDLAYVQLRKGETVSQGETWHDNAEFEECVRKESMLNSQMAELSRAINKLVVIDQVSQDTSRLRIGQVAVLDVGGSQRECLVGGYEETDLNAVPQVISYLAPLIRPFIGKEPGHTEIMTVSGKRVEVVLEDVTLPTRGG